jgi:glucose-1-phosphate adenylyltransferase
VNVGRHAKIRRAIIDKGVCIPQGIEIGYDRETDLGRGFTVTEKGITVIAKTHGIEQFFGKERS